MFAHMARLSATRTLNAAAGAEAPAAGGGSAVHEAGEMLSPALVPPVGVAPGAPTSVASWRRQGSQPALGSALGGHGSVLYVRESGGAARAVPRRTITANFGPGPGGIAAAVAAARWAATSSVSGSDGGALAGGRCSVTTSEGEALRVLQGEMAAMREQLAAMQVGRHER
jgi:hypothetical protein